MRESKEGTWQSLEEKIEERTIWYFQKNQSKVILKKISLLNVN